VRALDRTSAGQLVLLVLLGFCFAVAVVFDSVFGYVFWIRHIALKHVVGSIVFTLWEGTVTWLIWTTLQLQLRQYRRYRRLTMLRQNRRGGAD
jgi:hypothetical protein